MYLLNSEEEINEIMERINPVFDEKAYIEINNEQLKSVLYKFVFVTNYSERIKEELPSLSESDLLYSQYYWFTKFKKGYTQLYGEDASMEQQAFKIIETINTHLGEKTDWELIERFDKDVIT